MSNLKVNGLLIITTYYYYLEKYTRNWETDGERHVPDKFGKRT